MLHSSVAPLVLSKRKMLRHERLSPSLALPALITRVKFETRSHLFSPGCDNLLVSKFFVHIFGVQEKRSRCVSVKRLAWRHSDKVSKLSIRFQLSRRSNDADGTINFPFLYSDIICFFLLLYFAPFSFVQRKQSQPILILFLRRFRHP